MDNLQTLIYNELFEYHYNLSPDGESDLDLISMYRIENLPFTSNRTRMVLDNYNNIYNNDDNNRGINSNILTKKIIYPKFQKWGQKYNSKCIICLDRITHDQYVYNLKCGTEHQLHIFHKLCLEKWNKSSCPYCRSEITNELNP
jgi:hypothetical protein